jgi:hypothetical protein
MPEIRHLRIERFRGIAQMEWVPKIGINAIVGPGDAAKSTILDPIEVVLSRRGAPFTEVDFTDLDTARPIVIDLTMGDLPPPLTDIELYGSALRGWLDAFDVVCDEPGPDIDTFRSSSFLRGLNKINYTNKLACDDCKTRSQCTNGQFRTVSRLENEAVLDRMQARVAKCPGILDRRRESVEHPFGTIKVGFHTVCKNYAAGRIPENIWKNLDS